MDYADLKINDPLFNAASFLTQNAIMPGDTEGNFSPTQNVTWASSFILLHNFFDFLVPDFMKSSSHSSTSLRWFKEKNPHHTWVAHYFSFFWDNELIDKNKKGWCGTLENPVFLQDVWKIIKKFSKISSDKLNTVHLPRFPQEYYQAPLTRGIFAKVIYEIIKTIALPIEQQINTSLNRRNYYKAVKLIDENSQFIPVFSTDISLLCKLALRTIRNNVDIASTQVEAMYSIIQIKQKFRMSPCTPSVYHYTTLSALNSLTSPKAKFRAYHTLYLNDPTEGQRARDLFGELKLPAYLEKWTPFQIENSSELHGVFSISFINDSQNSLSMWAQYGGEYKGCRIQFKSENILSNYDLYQVIYDPCQFKNRLQEIVDIVNNYFVERTSQNINLDDPVLSFAQSTFYFLSYLYKDRVFKNEHEVRLLLFEEIDSAIAEDFIREDEDFPRIYQEISLPTLSGSAKFDDDSPLSFEEILLGPKVSKPERIKLSLIQRGYKASCIKINDIKLQ